MLEGGECAGKWSVSYPVLTACRPNLVGGLISNSIEEVWGAIILAGPRGGKAEACVWRGRRS